MKTLGKLGGWVVAAVLAGCAPDLEETDLGELAVEQVEAEVGATEHEAVSAEDSAEDEQAEAPRLPPKRVKLGRRTLTCQSEDAGKCRSMSERVAEYFARNSRGAFTLDYTTRGADYKFVVDTRSNHNNVGGLSSYQTDVAVHEMGHKLGLGHTTKVQRGPDGKFLRDYSSVMNGRAVGTPFLVAPEYYTLGWLPEAEVVLFDGTSTELELKRISDFKAQGVATVIVTSHVWNKVNPGAGRPVFISFPSPGNCRFPRNTECFALHFSSEKSSQLIAAWDSTEPFTDDRRNGTGIRVTRLPGSSAGKIRIRVETP